MVSGGAERLLSFGQRSTSVSHDVVGGCAFVCLCDQKESPGVRMEAQRISFQLLLGMVISKLT